MNLNQATKMRGCMEMALMLFLLFQSISQKTEVHGDRPASIFEKYLRFILRRAQITMPFVTLKKVKYYDLLTNRITRSVLGNRKPDLLLYGPNLRGPCVYCLIDSERRAKP